MATQPQQFPGAVVPNLGRTLTAPPLAIDPRTIFQQPPRAVSGPPQEQRGLMNLLRDPRTVSFLLSAANALQQPRGPGQTGMGSWVNAITQGYNAIALVNAMQAQRAAQEREEHRAALVAGIKALGASGEYGLTEAQRVKTVADTEAVRGAESRAAELLPLEKARIEAETEAKLAGAALTQKEVANFDRQFGVNVQLSEAQTAKLRSDIDTNTQRLNLDWAKHKELERSGQAQEKLEGERIKLEQQRLKILGDEVTLRIQDAKESREWNESKQAELFGKLVDLYAGVGDVREDEKTKKNRFMLARVKALATIRHLRQHFLAQQGWTLPGYRYNFETGQYEKEVVGSEKPTGTETPETTETPAAPKTPAVPKTPVGPRRNIFDVPKHIWDIYMWGLKRLGTPM